jgi:hypothetical protein
MSYAANGLMSFASLLVLQRRELFYAVRVGLCAAVTFLKLVLVDGRRNFQHAPATETRSQRKSWRLRFA